MKRLSLPKLSIPLFTKIALPAAVPFFLYQPVVEALEKRNVYLYFCGHLAQDFIATCIVLGAAHLLSGLAVWVWFRDRNVASRVITAVFTALFSFGLFWLWGISGFSNPRYAFHEIESPDGAHRIVVEEMGFLWDGWGHIYEQTGRLTLAQVGEYRMDDNAGAPFSDGAYYFIWHEDSFELHFDDDIYHDEGDYETVVMACVA